MSTDVSHTLRRFIRYILLEKTRYAKEKGRRYDPRDELFEKYRHNPYAFVHYSDINKLGINPRSDFNTPLGIYGYPLGGMLGMKVLTGDVPFAGDRKYIHVFVAKPEHQDGIVFVGSDGRAQDDDRYKALMEDIINAEPADVPAWFTDTLWEVINELNSEGLPDNLGGMQVASNYTTRLQKVLDDIEDDGAVDDANYGDLKFIAHAASFFEAADLEIAADFKRLAKGVRAFKTRDGTRTLTWGGTSPRWLIHKAIDEAKLDSNFAQYWNLTRLLTKDLREWRSMLLKHGIKGIVDHGSGILHDAEPVQGVFFSKEYIEQVATLPNPKHEKERRANEKFSKKSKEG